MAQFFQKMAWNWLPCKQALHYKSRYPLIVINSPRRVYEACNFWMPRSFIDFETSLDFSASIYPWNLETFFEVNKRGSFVSLVDYKISIYLNHTTGQKFKLVWKCDQTLLVNYLKAIHRPRTSYEQDHQRIWGKYWILPSQILLHLKIDLVMDRA